MKFTIRQIDDAHVILSIKGFEVHVNRAILGGCG